MDLAIGNLAPQFFLPDENEKLHKLSDYLGKVVVLFFYPEDDTPGCIKEVCNFRDDYSQYQKSDAILLGISPNDSRSHKKFQEKYNLPFTLLADDGHKVCEEYGVWGPKKLFGLNYEGLIRSTFLIDKAGKIANIFQVNKISIHSEKVLEQIALLSI